MDGDVWLYFWFFWFAFSLIIGAWSRRKGGSFIAGFAFSLLLSPLVAGLIVAVRKPMTETIEERELASGTVKKCPFCAELVKSEARVCRFCGRELSQGTQRSVPAPLLAARTKVASKVYYYFSEDSESGPHTLQDMIDFFEAGVINAETPVRKASENEWLKFDSHPEMKKS
jgi:hypothetical protein